METVKKFYRVDRREIAFIRFVFEACEGIATMRTLDGPSGLVAFSISPGCEDEVDAVLHDLKDGIMIESVVPGEALIRISHEY